MDFNSQTLKDKTMWLKKNLRNPMTKMSSHLILKISGVVVDGWVGGLSKNLVKSRAEQYKTCSLKSWLMLSFLHIKIVAKRLP